MEESGTISKRLTDIIARERERFVGFVRSKLVGTDETDAEDVVSEVTFNLLRRSDIISEVENLTAYIYRSLTNRIADHRRRQVPTIRIDDRGDDPERPAMELPDNKLSPAHAIEQDELRERLRMAISQLSPTERAVWLATEIDGRSFRELAEDWNVPIGTLLSRKSRANAELRRMLSDYHSKT
jgi:RNA polymerase sigma factor (sigma-70 family)